MDSQKPHQEASKPEEAFTGAAELTELLTGQEDSAEASQEAKKLEDEAIIRVVEEVSKGFRRDHYEQNAELAQDALDKMKAINPDISWTTEEVVSFLEYPEVFANSFRDRERNRAIKELDEQNARFQEADANRRRPY